MNSENKNELRSEDSNRNLAYGDLDKIPREVAEQKLFDGLKRLTEKQQEIIRLRHEEKMAFVAIASHLNCSAQSAEQLWQEAIEELAKHI